MQYYLHFFRKTLVVLLFQFSVVNSFAQTNLLDGFVKVAMPVYEPPFPELVKIELPTLYSAAAFDSALRGIDFAKIDILAWDLVFTRHPIGVNHNQLNENRLQWFKGRLPAAFDVAKHQTRIVEQTKAKTKEAAAKLFHGFAIYYRKKAVAEDVEKELKIIESIVTGKPISTDDKPAPRQPPRLPKPFNAGKLNKRQTVPFKVDEVEYIYTCLTEPIRRDMAAYYDSIEVVSLNELMDRSMLFTRSTYASCDSIIIGYKFKKAEKVLKITDMSFFDDTLVKKLPKLPPVGLPDSTVLKALMKSSNSQTVICTDVTQSMSPFTKQLFLWLQQQTKLDSQAVYYFFNDGDSKRESEKTIGKIGGIYKIKSTNFNVIAKTAYTAMRNGYGGDAPENNIECLLRAQKDNPAAKEIIMIADNWAWVKDMELLNNLKIPIRIILCGNKRNIMPDYLTIAYRTGGSIHTFKTEIKDLSKFKEGQELEFNGVTYKLIGNEFVVMPRRS